MLKGPDEDERRLCKYPTTAELLPLIDQLYSGSMFQPAGSTESRSCSTEDSLLLTYQLLLDGPAAQGDCQRRHPLLRSPL